MNLNLDTLKTEILTYLEASEFAVFRSHAGDLEGLPMVCWDSERYPDYRMFLEVGHRAGAKIVLFAAREFEEAEMEEALEDLEEADVAREEYRDYERRLREYSGYSGVTCSLEMAFDHNSRMYIYEVHPDWYDEFLELTDEISARMPVEAQGGEEEEDHGLGGFYSNN